MTKKSHNQLFSETLLLFQFKQKIAKKSDEKLCFDPKKGHFWT